MATVFWDTEGVILMDILSKGSTITGACYTNLLDQLKNAIYVDVISGLTKKSGQQLRSGSMERTLTSSLLGCWHLNTVGPSA